ncbi:MAG: SDR family oxidoreductase [Candidatus Peribacteraceae bacterium]|nr:SDR family oxidoreductase [Candidatus Peribacteraceae bacterium]
MSKEYAVVVGSARGIGKAVYDRLKMKGMNVIGLDLDYENTLNQGDADLRFKFDVLRYDHRGHLARDFAKHGDKVSSLIYCVGNNKLHWIGDGIGSLAQHIMDSNVVGIFHMLEALLSYMTDDCRIILYSSIAGEVPMRTTAPYCVSKAAVDMLVKCLARELAPKPVFCVKPGPTDGDNSWEETIQQICDQRGWSKEKVIEMAVNDIPMKKFATEQECAEVTLDLITRAPAHMSGTTIRLTGGR